PVISQIVHIWHVTLPFASQAASAGSFASLMLPCTTSVPFAFETRFQSGRHAHSYTGYFRMSTTMRQSATQHGPKPSLGQFYAPPTFRSSFGYTAPLPVIGSHVGRKD